MEGDKTGLMRPLSRRSFLLFLASYVFWDRSKHMKHKGLKERLFILTQTRSLQILGVIPIVKLQNQLNG